VGYAAFGLLILAFGAGALFALRPAATPQPNTSASITQVNLLLDGAYGARFAGESIASALGLFSSNIRLMARPGDSDFVENVAREHAIGVTSGHNFLLAAWRGAPVTAFAASFLDTSVAIFALESSGVRRPADLIGKRIGYRSGGEAVVIFDAMMAQLQLPRSQVQKVADRDSFDALRRKEVDAIVIETDHQQNSSIIQHLKVNVIKPQDYGVHVPGLVYFATNSLLHDKPSVIANVLQGIIRGWQLAYADYALSIPVLAAFDPERLTFEELRFELEQQRSLVLPVGGRIADYDESRWRTLRDILVFAKVGEERVPLAQTVNYQFLRDVYRRAPDLAGPGAWSGNK